MITNYDADGTPVLDLTQEVCPATFVRFKTEIEKIQSGAALEIILQEGEQLKDVPRGIVNEGHQIERISREADGCHLLVRRK